MPKEVEDFSVFHSLSCNIQVAIVLWNTILRFMGDMSEPRHAFLDTVCLLIISNCLVAPGCICTGSFKKNFPILFYSNYIAKFTIDNFIINDLQ